jgi:hypothetical protein
LVHEEIFHRVERNVKMRKKKNKSKFGNSEIIEIYSKLHTIFGDGNQLIEQAL